MRLLSYNIHKGIGGRDRLYRLERVIRAMEHERPDIVCLQEVTVNIRRNRFDHQPELLADWFKPASAIFQFNVKIRNGGYGNLVMSHWPFRSHHHLSVTRLRRKPRGAQFAVVMTPSGPLHLTHWHLGLSEHERRWQAKYVLEHNLYKEARALPSMIVGDSNDWRDKLETLHFEEQGFRQVTAPPSRFRSFPAWMPVWALDKAFVRGKVHVTRVHVVRGKLTRDASDHLPLVIDFELG